MKTIVIANFKGGTGKTFAAVVLSEMFAVAGQRVAVVDMDEQLNAIDYLRDVDGEAVFAGITPIASAGVEPDYQAIAAGGADVLIIDTPPRSFRDPAVRRVIGRADLVIIPLVLRLHALTAFDDLAGFVPDTVPILPMISVGGGLTKPKKDLLEKVRGACGVGSVLPAVVVPMLDRVDENLTARRPFWYRVSEKEYARFEALRDSVLATL